MRLAHVSSEPGFSGGESQLFLLMRGLRARGHHNTVVCPPGSRIAAAAAAEGFDVHTAPMRNDADLAGLLQLRRALRAAAPDLVTLHTGRADWLGGMAARSLGLPAIAVRRMDRRVRRGLRTRLVYRTFTRRVVAISPAVVDCLVEGGVPRARIVHVWEAVEPERLRPGRGAGEVRGAEGLEPGRTLLLVLASLDRRKGIDVLLDALAAQRARLGEPPPALWIAGDGPERGALAAQIARLDLGGIVRLLGRREDAPDLLAACDVFVLPSRREGLGVSALEAMAAGKPVVASRVGGLGQSVLHEETGLLVPPDDTAALGAALVRIVGDPELRARLGAGGPRRIAAQFLADRNVERYLELFEAVLAESRPRR